jgi:hypothetical protein
VNEGAAVRVSLVCFGVDSQTAALNGQAVARIHADLTGGNGLDLTLAQSLVANDSVAFKGAEKSGSFEIDGALARQCLSCPNPHGRSNAEVLLPWRNGADNLSFGILSSGMHEVWSLAQASMHGVGNDPNYNAKSCFETFPFPTGLTPADTAHQQTEQVEGGALIPAWVACADGLRVEPAMTIPLPSTAIPLPAMTSHRSLLQLRAAAIQIATAAKKLNDLREAWLNPREWTHNVPEVTPLGMSESPYPDRIEPKPGISPDDLKALLKRTLTNLYNLRPQWLVMAHQQLDHAVAQAYGWSDYSAGMPDEEILKRLLALNLQRSATIE